MNTINTFMLNSSKYSSKKTCESTQSDSLKKLKHLGETMIVDKKFDIKHYLETAENQFRFKSERKRYLKNIFNFSTDYLNYKPSKEQPFSEYTNNNFYNISLNSNSKYRNDSFNDNKNSFSLNMTEKKMPNINMYSLSMNRTKNTISNFNKNKMSYFNNYSNYHPNDIRSKIIKNQMNSRYRNMFDENKGNIKIENNEDDSNTRYDKYLDDDDEQDKKIFKIEKVVKEIKKNKNKSFDYNKYKEKVKNYYDKKNVLIGLNSDNVLNNYKVKQKKLRGKETPIKTFITENKEISIKNLLIKIINKENDKLIKKERKISKDLKDNKFNLENDEKKFAEYVDLQKLECKKIGMILSELQKRNRNLMGEEKKYKLEVKIKEYEIYKILVQMNLFRFYAKFANQILDGDASRFQNPIISEDIEFDKINFEPIIKEVIDNYSSMKKFDPKKDKNGHNKMIKYYKEEGYFLYDPELVYHKYNEIEGNILRLLEAKEKLLIKIKKRQKQNNEALSYLIDRCNILKQEYDELNKFYNEENQKYLNYIKNNGMTHINVNILEKNNLIKELYMSVIEQFEPTIKKICKMNNRDFQVVDRRDLVQFDDIIKYGQDVLENLEINLNCILLKMKDDEEKDKNIFDKVIYGIKVDYKLIRQSLFFENKKKKQIDQRIKAIEKAKKIVLSSRKCEPPYYNIKKNKKEKIDVNLIKKEEDKELITYH